MRVLSGVMVLALAAANPPVENPAGVAADLLAEMVRNSPFIPAGGATAGGDAARGELELRGVVWDGGAYRFSIFDPAKRESVWTKLDEPGHPFLARSFDRERDVLTVEFQGRVLVLELAEAEQAESTGGDAAAGPQSTPLPTPGEAQPGRVPRPGPGVGTPPMPTGASTQDAQQLQQMADEVRRRRGVGPPPESPKN